MNYQRIYNQLIAGKEPRVKDKNNYFEKHHIVPRCLGGSNEKENLVLLTGREHFVAHLLLVKIHPRNHKLRYALNAMLRSRDYQSRDLKSWEVEAAKKLYAEARSEKAKLLVGDKNPNFGNHWTDGQKLALSKKKKGTLLGDLNPAKRPESREKIKEGKLGGKNPNAQLWTIQNNSNGEITNLHGGLKRFLNDFQGSSYFKLLNDKDPNWKLVQRGS